MPHATPLLPQLFVNDGPLDPSNISFLRPSYPTEPLEELRASYEENGYLFLKQLIPRSDVLKAREKYFEYLAPSGILAPGTTPEQGIFDSSKDHLAYPGIGAGAAGKNGKPGGPEAEIFVDRALEAHKMDWYAEDFCKHPVLVDFVKKFTTWGESTVCVQRTLLRNNVPGNKAIGVHYDQIFLRHGEPTSLTAWVPMGDIHVEGGGLIYLEKGVLFLQLIFVLKTILIHIGHTLGLEQERKFTRDAIEGGLTEEEAKNAFNANMMNTGLLDEGPARYGIKVGRRWLVTDYEGGDVVLHNPFMIHASTLNRDSKNVIRLATDLRFVDGREEWDRRWDKVYEIGDGV
jgi:phytanoyl-CoA hydroxylase